jgi:hypothetical protein
MAELSYIGDMRRVFCLLAAGVLLSLVVSQGLVADSKKLRKSKSIVSESKQKPPADAQEVVLPGEHPDKPPEAQSGNEGRVGEEVNWRVMSSGGRPTMAEDLVISGTIGQFAVGSATSGDIGVHHGYWQDFGESESYVCGDANSSGYVDIDDVVYILLYAFAEGPPPVPLESADTNCTGSIDIDDVVLIIEWAFMENPAGPCDPDGDGVPDC